MPVTAVSDLSSPQREVLNRAKAAMTSHNYDYTITLMQGILKVAPLFVDGRHLLRAAGISKYKGLSGLAKKMTGAKVMTKAATLSAKKPPADIMAACEDVLAIDPFNAKANNMLAEAARQMECLEITSLCYETLKEGLPKDIKNLYKLAEIYMEMGLPDKAETTYEAILAVNPAEGEAKSGMKNASAANAAKTGNWEAAEDSGDFRAALRDEKSAQSLEMQNKVVKSEDAVLTQIQEIHALSEQEPDNLTHLKKIAQLYEQIEDFDNAVAWYSYAYTKGGSTDGSIEKIIDDIKLRSIDKQMRELQPSIATDPSLQEQYDGLQAQKLQVRVETAKRRVERYPNDYQFRFEHGEALVDSGDYQNALKELQLGTKQPNVRLKAMELIGLCHWHGTRYDMAKDSFMKARAEMPAMDGPKMDVTYNLAQLCEGTGENTQAIELYKEIYEVDMSYKDVAAKVEGSYGG